MLACKSSLCSSLSAILLFSLFLLFFLLLESGKLSGDLEGVYAREVELFSFDLIENSEPLARLDLLLPSV
jgi:hypothetical protein